MPSLTELEFLQSVLDQINAERACQDYGQKELELLDEIAENKTGLGSASTLLRSPIGLLVASPEKGESQFRTHPLAESLQERYRTKLTPAGT